MRSALLAGLAATVLAVMGPPARAADQGDIDKAVARGIDFLHSAAFPSGNELSQPVGVMALTGLTLLECGAGPDDKTVQAAAANVRLAGVSQEQTYTLALSILFLDRLGDLDDVPLIESMTVRLLAGQTAGGGWSYFCPAIPESEVRRLTAHLKQQTELVGRRDPPKATEADKDKDGKTSRRTAKDLPKEIQEQIVLINRMGPPGGAAAPAGFVGGDNSNTQFATVALWVARRHGLPVDLALGRIDRRYRLTQNADGGWSYVPMPSPSAMGTGMGMIGSTATMTCAGLLGLTVAQGVVADADHEAGKSGPDLGKDQVLKKALALLGTALDDPADKRPAPVVGGKTYYFLWSLERVAVALNLETVGGKDWYGWGSDILVANQSAAGSWQGEYAPAVDTCFALLFLKRANLTSDLTASLKGKTKDLGGVNLKAGGVGGEALKGGLKSGVESKDKPANDGPGVTGKPLKDPGEGRLTPAAGDETEGGRMARELAQAPAGRREELVTKYRDGKGVTYTEALAGAIPQLTGEGRRLAREALTDRLTRMKPETLARYFEDQDAEVRRAAALAAAQREAKTLIPDLILLLNDAEPSVARAAQAAMKDLTGETLGPSADEWKAWWDKQERK